ncbi:unnamed protein product [Tilletia controversa]|nr:unnamed protein product [Tilletia controversa]
MSGQPVLQDDNTSLVDEAGDDPLNLGNSDSGAPNETGQLDWAGCISALQISLRLRFPTPYLYLKWAFQAEAAKDKTHPAPTSYAGLKKLFAGVRRSPYALVRALRRFYALNTNLGPGISVIVVMVIAGINMDFSAILYTYAGLSLFDPTAREPQDASLQPRWMNYRIPQLDHMYWVHFGLTTAVVVLSWLWPYLPWSREWCAWILAWVYGETVQMNEETIENNSKKTDDAAGSQVQDGATTTAMNPNVTKAMKRVEYSKIEDKPRLEGHTYNHGQMQNIIDALGTKLETLKEEMLRTFDLTEDINRRQKRWEKRPKTLQTMFNSDIPETIRNFQVLWRTIKVDVPSASLTNVSVNYVVVLTQVAELYFLLFDYAPKKTEEALRFLEIAAGHQIRAVEVWPDAEQVKLFEASDFYLDTILKSRFDVPIPLGKNGDLSAATIFAHLKFLKKRLPHSYWFLAQPTPMIVSLFTTATTLYRHAIIADHKIQDTAHDSAWVDKVPITRIVTWRSEVEGESGDIKTVGDIQDWVLKLYNDIEAEWFPGVHPEKPTAAKPKAVFLPKPNLAFMALRQFVEQERSSKEFKQPKQPEQPKEFKQPKQPKQPEQPKQIKQPKQPEQPEQPEQPKQPKPNWFPLAAAADTFRLVGSRLVKAGKLDEARPHLTNARDLFDDLKDAGPELYKQYEGNHADSLRLLARSDSGLAFEAPHFFVLFVARNRAGMPIMLKSTTKHLLNGACHLFKRMKGNEAGAWTGEYADSTRRYATLMAASEGDEHHTVDLCNISTQLFASIKAQVWAAEHYGALLLQNWIIQTLLDDDESTYWNNASADADILDKAIDDSWTVDIHTQWLALYLRIHLINHAKSPGTLPPFRFSSFVAKFHELPKEMAHPLKPLIRDTLRFAASTRKTNHIISRHASVKLSKEFVNAFSCGKANLAEHWSTERIFWLACMAHGLPLQPQLAASSASFDDATKLWNKFKQAGESAPTNLPRVWTINEAYIASDQSWITEVEKGLKEFGLRVKQHQQSRFTESNLGDHLQHRLDDLPPPGIRSFAGIYLKRA